MFTEVRSIYNRPTVQQPENIFCNANFHRQVVILKKAACVPMKKLVTGYRVAHWIPILKKRFEESLEINNTNQCPKNHAHGGNRAIFFLHSHIYVRRSMQFCLEVNILSGHVDKLFIAWNISFHKNSKYHDSFFHYFVSGCLRSRALSQFLQVFILWHKVSYTPNLNNLGRTIHFQKSFKSPSEVPTFVNVFSLEKRVQFVVCIFVLIR